MIGLTLSFAVHCIAALVITQVEKRPPKVADPDEKPIVVRVDNSDIQLPKLTVQKAPEPTPPEPERLPPEPEPEPEPPPEQKPPEPPPEPTPQQPKPRPKRPVVKEKEPPPPQPSPPPEPAPVVLSNVSLGGGIQVQKGERDVLGDPSVAATEENTRRLPTGPAAPDGTGTGGSGQAAVVPTKAAVYKPPRRKLNPKGKWPTGAPTLNRTIEVKLSLDLDEEGKVTNVAVLVGAGEPFDSDAIRVAKRAVFYPATRDDVPIATTVPYSVVYEPP